ncbi:hypothetical protein TWF730_000187 [Orbilia blumenaviensis]|uniref:F-box domain-containing protein n=1 Tax=Orbilia blumenaviensis TaxID=1796055 RepID=A0AAV9VKS5_9PEZI
MSDQHIQTEPQAQAQAQISDITLLSIPPEMINNVLSNLSKDDLKCFAHCSKFCYNIALFHRFRGVILTPNALLTKIFQDDGICEGMRESIRSARFNEPGNWTDGPPGWCSARHASYLDPEAAVSDIITKTASLQLFPNLTELSISYTIPWQLEKNVYISTIKRISSYPFFKNLKRLEFVIFNCWARYCTDEPYDYIMSLLTIRSRLFLGWQEVGDDKMKRVLGACFEGKALPELQVAKISMNGLASPTDPPDSPYLPKSGFYYQFLNLATPNLVELNIETTERDRNLIFDPHGVLTLDPTFPPGEQFQSNNLQRLNLMKNSLLKAEDFVLLAQRYPNIKRLRLTESIRSIPFDHRTEDVFEDLHDGITEFKEMEWVCLPWPRYELPKLQQFGGGVEFDLIKGIGWGRNINILPIEALEMLVVKWIWDGMEKLKTVEFWAERQIRLIITKEWNGELTSWIGLRDDI